MPDRIKNQVIQINTLKKAGISSGRVEAVQQAIQPSVRPNLSPAKEELEFDVSASTIASAVVVGIRPLHSPAKVGNKSCGN